MPVYEYSCNKCGKITETFQKVHDPPLKRCGDCGGDVSKVFHPAGLVFKGSGFYVTDYGQRKKKEQPEAPKKQEPKKEKN